MRYPYMKYNGRHLPIIPVELKIRVYIHNLKIKLADNEFNAVIGFSRRLGIGFNVLGQESIFDRFRICFDRKEKIVALYPKEFNK